MLEPASKDIALVLVDFVYRRYPVPFAMGVKTGPTALYPAKVFGAQIIGAQVVIPRCMLHGRCRVWTSVARL